MALSALSWQKTTTDSCPFLFTPNIFLISYFYLRAHFSYSSIPLASRLFGAIFSQPFIDSLPLHHLPWSPGSSFLVAQKTSVTDCLPPVRL